MATKGSRSQKIRTPRGSSASAKDADVLPTIGAGVDPKAESSDLTATRRDRGKKSHTNGLAFEHQVAEIYRLLHYDVQSDRLFSGRQVDLFLTGRFGDMTLFRAIECKSGPVTADHMDSFVAKLRLVRDEYPSVHGT